MRLCISTENMDITLIKVNDIIIKENKIYINNKLVPDIKVNEIEEMIVSEEE